MEPQDRNKDRQEAQEEEGREEKGKRNKNYDDVAEATDDIARRNK